MDLSIIIVNWNTRDYLAHCLKSLRETASRLDPPFAALMFGDYTAAVLVVDNASTDASPQMVRQDFPWVRLIENDHNAGFAPANNQAIGASQGRYILLLNSDTEVCSGALETLISFMEANPHAGAAGPRLLNADGSLQPSVHPMLTPWREFWRLMFLDSLIHRATYSSKMWQARTPQPVDTIKGACLMLRREALEQVGLLDESYFMYTEEVDLCYRLLHQGWTLHWVPQASVVHYGEASSKQMAEVMYVQLYRSKVQFYRKTGGEAYARLFKRLVTLAYWPRVVAAKTIALLQPRRVAQARLFQRLLDELPAM